MIGVLNLETVHEVRVVPWMQTGSQNGGHGLTLVTGASGFVGSAVAAALRRSGYGVRVLVRPSSPRTNVDPADEVAVGDILDRPSIAAALEGVRYLVHAAADYRLWAPSADDIIRTNVEGTRILMEQAARAGVERIVYTSSVATIACSREGLGDETRPLQLSEAIGAYKRSKVMAERLVSEMVEKSGLPAVIVNPSTPIGPRDVRPTPTGHIIVRAASGRLPHCDGGRALRPDDRTGPVRHARRVAHVSPPYVFHRYEGAPRSWLRVAALLRRHRRCHRLVRSGRLSAAFGLTGKIGISADLEALAPRRRDR